MPEPLPTVGVVTVTYNSHDVLDGFLTSIRAQRGVKVRLYVIDSGSSDDTVELVREAEMPDMFIQAEADNVGIAVGNNIGIRQAMEDGCDWVMLLNNDTEFGPDLIAEMVGEADQNALDILAPITAAAEPSDTINYAGGHLKPWQAFRAVHEQEGAPLEHAPRELLRTDFAPACCLLIRPRVFDRTGLMNPTTFVYFDDVDFAIRAKAAGFRYWVTPRATLLHKVSTLTGGAGSDFGTYWMARNWPLMARMHATLPQRVAGITYIAVWLVARLVLGRDSIARFQLRVRGLKDGLTLRFGEPERL